MREAGGGGVGEGGGAAKYAVELALLSAGAPLDLKALSRVLGDGADAAAVRGIVAELRDEWAPRALRLIESAGGWQFVSRPAFVPFVRRLNPERPPRLSRPMLEILAVVAYRQPVTRGDVEQIRGSTVTGSQVAFLEELGWIEEVGRRETPGRPVLYATTGTFLDDLGLASLNELPALPDAEEDEMGDALGGGGDDDGQQSLV